MLLDELLALFVELDERIERALLAACHRGDGHVVEQVEALVRRRLVVQVLGRLEPFLADAARDAADLLELLLVPLLARDLLELRDGVAELRAHVLDALAVDVVLVVEGNVDDDDGNVQRLAQVLVPLEHAIADVVATQDEIR